MQIRFRKTTDLSLKFEIFFHRERTYVELLTRTTSRHSISITQIIRLLESVDCGLVMLFSPPSITPIPDY